MDVWMIRTDKWIYHRSRETERGEKNQKNARLKRRYFIEFVIQALGVSSYLDIVFSTFDTWSGGVHTHKTGDAQTAGETNKNDISIECARTFNSISNKYN